jgi:hypothetical protein
VDELNEKGLQQREIKETSGGKRGDHFVREMRQRVQLHVHGIFIVIRSRVSAGWWLTAEHGAEGAKNIGIGSQILGPATEMQ